MNVTDHAVERWRKRSGATYSDEKCINKLIHMAESGREVELLPKFKAIALMNHRYKQAKYVRYGSYLLVIVDDTVVTLHTGEAKQRWEK